MTLIDKAQVLAAVDGHRVVSRGDNLPITVDDIDNNEMIDSILAAISALPEAEGVVEAASYDASEKARVRVEAARNEYQAALVALKADRDALRAQVERVMALRATVDADDSIDATAIDAASRRLLGESNE